ncbi:hypothetical protein T265_04386 [Opisthorchis viverrini]|uniref:Fanconi anemia group D2 protein n=1 Tax=Opisthorchis viverrini TaxID=6198 RepID=A0A075AGL6_OPIVI|nr:hypothetical protein T265_04386 [Opisthorchis viverrini]KER28844.1 hypothetical protein T265_04386 [Opisthorchis viverrini]
MGIQKCSHSGQFYFDNLPTSTLNTSAISQKTPWTTVHTSRERCKLAEAQFKESLSQVSLLIQELRNLALYPAENSDFSANFSDLLVPLLTAKPSDDSSDTSVDDDMLILFGAPATIFQLLFHIPSINSELTDLVLELGACSSSYSQQLLEQFRPPVGLPTMFSSKKAFSETATRLLQLFQIVSDPPVQSTILRILPDLASSLCASNCALNDEDRAAFVLQLMDLLRTVPVGRNPSAVSDQQDPINCLLDCLAGFSMSAEQISRLHTTCFDLLDRCYTDEAYYTYLPTIFRCLMINGPQVARNSPEASRLIIRLRKYFIFPRKPLELHGISVGDTLVELLRLAYRFNRLLMTEWMRAIDTSSISKLSDSSTVELTTIHNQAIQDFLILCVIYSTVDTNSTASLGRTPQGPYKETLMMCSNASSQFTRFQKETDSLVRRLALSDRMFPRCLRAELINQFLMDFGPTLMSERTRLFSAFSHFLDQLISVTGTAVGVSQSHNTVRQLGLSLYIETFCASSCTDGLKREIIKHLVRHGLTGLGSATGRQIGAMRCIGPIQTGLVALLRLAQRQPHQLVKFEGLLGGLVDHLFRSVSSQQTPTSDQGFVVLMDHARCLFTIMAWISFCRISPFISIQLFYYVWVLSSDRENKPFQEKLLGLLRKQFSSPCLTAKALSIIGAVVVLETICRRPSPCKAELEVACSTQTDDSIVLASQMTHLEVDRASTSTTSTTSCLSLRGPGTGLADDLDEVHLAADDTEDDRTDSVTHGDDSRCITPPSRLLLQLIGLVEHTISGYPQLKCLWLDELRACFCRLSQISSMSTDCATQTARSSRKSLFNTPSSVQAVRLINWMGARVMRDFQTDFIVDNATLEGFVPQLNLNDPSMCEVAINLGPSWTNYCFALSTSVARVRSLHLSDGKSRIPPSPIILPSQLAFLAEVERTKHQGRLDAIDALLGCPLLLLPSGHLPDSDAAQEVHLLDAVREEPQLILLIINWCVEAVNVFSPLFVAHFASSEKQSEGRDSSAASQADRHSCGDNESCPIRLQHPTVLSRLAQIAHLRNRLHVCLLRLDHQCPVPLDCSQDQPTVETQRLADLCLPTATFEPGRTWDSHPSRADSGRFPCFTCGIHLVSTANRNQVPSRKTGTSETKSKCAGKKRKRKFTARICKTKQGRGDESEDECLGGEDADNDATQVNSVSSDNESICVDSGGAPMKNSKKLLPSGASKLAAGKLKGVRNAGPVSPGLTELTACFRELDITSLFLGLSAWPWSPTRPTDANSTQCSGQMNCDRPSTLDWTTLAWLLEDFSSKLQHLSGIRPSFLTGWYSFQRLDQLRSDVRRTYFLQLIPSVHRAIVFATNFFLNDESGPSDDLQSSRSSGEGDPMSTMHQASRGKEISSKPDTFQPCVDLFSGTGALISNIICDCLQILCILLTGIHNPNSLAIPQPSHTTTEYSECAADNFRQLAHACASRETHVTGSVAVDDCPNKQDLFENLSDESAAKGTDSARCPVSDYRSFTKDVRVVLEWILRMSPAGLPHATAAYLHARLVYRTATVYLDCLNRLRQFSDTSLEEEHTWFPDLNAYTKSLLDKEWDPEVLWKGHTFRESLQGLLAMHLRFRPDTVEGITRGVRDREISILSPSFLLDLTRGLILPTVRRYQGQRGVQTSASETNCWDGYKTLTRQTMDIYCREVLSSVLWYMKQLCFTHSSSENSTNDCHLLACWNECIVVFGLLIDLVVSPSGTGGRHRTYGEQTTPCGSDRLLSSLVSTLLRTGRLFLQGLLKGCMPILSSLFRHRGVEVVTFLKNTQSLTRFLQRVCTHAKTNRDAKLANQIPATRRCLEIFVYRVKILLSQNQCSDAFWLGTLKNRDLAGVELPDDSDSENESQSTPGSARLPVQRRVPPPRISYSPSLPAEEIRGSIDSDLDGSEDDNESNVQSVESPTEADLGDSDHSDENGSEEEDGLIEPSDTESCQL